MAENPMRDIPVCTPTIPCSAFTSAATNDLLTEGSCPPELMCTVVRADGSTSCVDKGTYRDQVQANVDEGDRYGVAGTPTIFINGRLVAGAVPYEVYDQIVREELAAQAAAINPR